MRSIHLPDSLLSGLSARELSKAEIAALTNRLCFIDEIGDRLVSISSEIANSDEAIQEILEDIELDVAINLHIPSKEKIALSPWVIHTTWTLSIEEEDISGDTSDIVFRCLEISAVCTHADHDTIVLWLNKSGELLRDLLVRFSDSDTEGRAVIYLLLVDLVLSQLFHGIYRTMFAKKLRAAPRKQPQLR